MWGSFNCMFGNFVCFLIEIGAAVCCLSLVAASSGCAPRRCAGFPLQRLLLLRSTGSRARVQQSRLLASTARAQHLQHMDLVAPKHVKSSQTRDQTHVKYIVRKILNHWTTREVQFGGFLKPRSWPFVIRALGN